MVALFRSANCLLSAGTPQADDRSVKSLFAADHRIGSYDHEGGRLRRWILRVGHMVEQCRSPGLMPT